MRDILDDIRSWTEPFAIATVVATWKSSPRAPGASMAVSADGVAIGSVSGGCVEGAVYEVCEDVLGGGPAQLVRYGVSDDDAFSVGLTCGGTIEVFVRLVDPSDVRRVVDAVDERRPAASATVIASVDSDLVGRHLLLLDDERHGGTGSTELDDAVATSAQGLLEHGRNQVVHLGRHGEGRMEDVTVFVESFAPPARMVIFGAIDFASALARMGAFLGYHVTVCDARPVFTTRTRFPDVDDLVVSWPHEYLRTTAVDERTVLCVLTHDPKFDVPLLQEALRSSAGYIGVMGSRRTHADRNARLRELGVGEDDLRRLASPIGLDLGARTPEETAVSIASEIIARRWGGSGRPLAELDEPIHREHPLVTHPA